MAIVNDNYMLAARIAPLGTHVIFEIGTVLRKEGENYWLDLKDGGGWYTDHGLMRLKQAADSSMSWGDF